MDFSEKLRALRAQRGLTQLDIARRLDVTTAAVGAWENGRSRPRLNKLSDLADYLGAPVAYLTGDAFERTPVASSRMVPVLGFAHMGGFEDEGEGGGEVEVPASIADAHPNAFMVHAQGACMDNLFPTDALLLVDPDMEPQNGRPVLAETEDYGAVVRTYTRGTSTVLLTADSHTGEYDDIVAGPDDPPVTCRGRVVWYMGERDEREAR